MDEEPGINDRLLTPYMFIRIAATRSMCCRVQSRDGKVIQASFRGRGQEVIPDITILDPSDNRKVNRVVSFHSNRRLPPMAREATTKQSWYPSLKYERALARLQGDESLLASLPSLGAVGRNSAEFGTGAIPRKRSGVAAKMSTMVDQKERTNDATSKPLPFQYSVYIVFDSALKLKTKKAKVGYHRPKLTTRETLNAVGLNKVPWDIEAGAEIKHNTRAVDDYTDRSRLPRSHG